MSVFAAIYHCIREVQGYSVARDGGLESKGNRGACEDQSSIGCTRHRLAVDER